MAVVALDPRGRVLDTSTMVSCAWPPVAGSTVPLSGTNFDAQIALVLIGRRYMVAFPLTRGPRVESLAAFAAREEATAIVVESHQVGRARGSLLGDGDSTHAAMAVAVVMYAWAWDESEEILVELGTTTFAVHVVVGGSTFLARATTRG